MALLSRLPPGQRVTGLVVYMDGEKCTQHVHSVSVRKQRVAFELIDQGIKIQAIAGE